MDPPKSRSFYSSSIAMLYLWANFADVFSLRMVNFFTMSLPCGGCCSSGSSFSMPTCVVLFFITQSFCDLELGEPTLLSSSPSEPPLPPPLDYSSSSWSPSVLLLLVTLFFLFFRLLSPMPLRKDLASIWLSATVTPGKRLCWWADPAEQQLNYLKFCKTLICDIPIPKERNHRPWLVHHYARSLPQMTIWTQGAHFPALLWCLPWAFAHSSSQ